MANTRQVGALLLVTGAALAFWSFGDKGSTSEHEVSGKISTVELDSPNADITIKVGSDDKTTIQEKRTYWLVKHGDAYSVNGETLKLDGDCGWQCRADFVVTVPAGTKVSGDNGSGDLAITGVAGVDASSRSGEISLHDVTGDVKLNLTSGDVEIDKLTGKLEVEATSGDVNATHLKGGAVNVQTTSGDLRLELDEQNDVRAKGTSSDVQVVAPAGGYKIRTETRSGEINSGLNNDPNGSHTIEASTVSGDVALAAR